MTLNKSLSLKMFGQEEEILGLHANTLLEDLKLETWYLCNTSIIMMPLSKISLSRLLMWELDCKEFHGLSMGAPQATLTHSKELMSFWMEKLKSHSKMMFGILLAHTAVNWTLMKVKILTPHGNKLLKLSIFLLLISKEPLSLLEIYLLSSIIQEQLWWLLLMVGFPATQEEVQIAGTFWEEFLQLLKRMTGGIKLEA